MAAASATAVRELLRKTVSREFDDLVRAIGEAKSKGEEDAIVGRIVEIVKAELQEGRRDVRTLKEVLTYLIYVEMLGHDTAWAQAAVIRLCGEKNLVVKKVGWVQQGEGPSQAGAGRQPPPAHGRLTPRPPARPPADGLPGRLPADRPLQRADHPGHGHHASRPPQRQLPRR